ncbi:MAG: endolytic transglycosylase MltG [Alphaproteobacteria bacterium HGW-Alphaproteobacteria-8]|jgi:UPF0755 protein|nr:MAG: endolytic transglycosylase MltG [Alphaproteobacteria bacterium HGW-Alphaproteobacteria-8]
MRSIAANALTLMIVLGVALAAVVGYGVRGFNADGPLDTPATFVVARGAALERVANDLEQAGVIDSATLFRLGARYQGKDGALRYGEYAIPPRASMASVLDLLVSGKVVQYSIAVAEGLTSWEVVEILKASDVLTGEVEAVPAEGALAPDTYAVQRGDTRAEVLARMAALQTRRVAEAWAARAADLPFDTPQQAVTLASIIEKETGVAAERALVSAVFHNRLKRGMRLQSDPTIIYGITEGKGPLDRALTRGDIQRATAWNTYAIDGLPKTPIANPGREALMAAVRPAESDDLYFVADGSGGHAFARTLAEHNRNVAAWRAIERNRRAP